MPRAPGRSVRPSKQTCWEVPDEVIRKYPGHFLAEDKTVFRRI